MTAAAELVARTTAAQGLPARITDPGVLERVATIVARRDEAGPATGPATATNFDSTTRSSVGGRCGEA